MKLRGKIALVAGATRGAGRAIALTLAEEGATVYGTGRGIGKESKFTAIRADHTDPRQVMRVVSRIRREAGHLDILVNDIWGGDELTEWGKRIWEANVQKGLTMLERAVHTHLITSRYAIPLMIGVRGSGSGVRGTSPEPRTPSSEPRLIIEVTDGEGMYYRGNIYYDLVKTSAIRLAFGMAQELKRSGVAAIAVTPGFLRSERMLEHFGVTEENWRDGTKRDPLWIASETPFYVGRAVAALAADKNVMKKSGRVFTAAELAEEYGFTDADGSRPSWRKYIEKNAPRYFFPRLDETFWSYCAGPYEVFLEEWDRKRKAKKRLL
ncbi:MAG TPA: SDR family NAD(P)-dependent oxidoreductase [Thermoanaerobaculia bacterium]|nr:SDR family NAD(P)-dependent oxidoreductase [Thermoanaerobaculia bacterium]